MATTTALPLLANDLDACCTPLTDGVIDAESAGRLALMFRALGDPTRVRLVSMIAATEGGEACICDLTAPVGLSQGTVSHHMKILADAGLVSREQRGRWAFYRVEHSILTAMATALDSTKG